MAEVEAAAIAAPPLAAPPLPSLVKPQPAPSPELGTGDDDIWEITIEGISNGRGNENGNVDERSPPALTPVSPESIQARPSCYEPAKPCIDARLTPAASASTLAWELMPCMQAPHERYWDACSTRA